MDMTLVDLCKLLRVNGVYAYVEEYQPDNPDLERFLTSALVHHNTSFKFYSLPIIRHGNEEGICS
jgi:hypothetical protein